MNKSVIFALVIGFLSVFSQLVFAEDEQKIYKVVNIPVGKSLEMHSSASEGAPVVVKMPHNAHWVVLKGANAGWEQISWNNQSGWVKKGFLIYDAIATQTVVERRYCMNNPKVKDKTCCGFPELAKSNVFQSVKIYTVSGVREGKTLAMYSRPDNGSDVVVALPHNAGWIAELGEENGDWVRVRWSGQNGWVKKNNIAYSETQTAAGDAKRKKCGVDPNIVPYRPPEGCKPNLSRFSQ